MMQRFVYHARGLDHIETGDPCQDAYLTARCGDAMVFGVSDGVGSRKHSERGSRVAVASAVLYVSNHLESGMADEDVRDVIRAGFAVAYHTVCDTARRAGEPARELDATLCVGVWDGKRLSWGQAGDSGMVAALATGEYVMVTHQQHDDAGGMIPLRFGPDTWEFGTVEGNVASVLAATDGLFERLCPKLLRETEQPVYVPLARKLLHRTEAAPEERRALDRRLRNIIRREPRLHTVDDATLLLLYDPERPPATLDDAYYQEPAWEELRNAVAERIKKEWAAETAHMKRLQVKGVKQ